MDAQQRTPPAPTHLHLAHSEHIIVPIPPRQVPSPASHASYTSSATASFSFATSTTDLRPSRYGNPRLSSCCSRRSLLVRQPSIQLLHRRRWMESLDEESGVLGLTYIRHLLRNPRCRPSRRCTIGRWSCGFWFCGVCGRGIWGPGRRG